MCWAKQTRDLHKVDKIIFQSYVEKVKYFFLGLKAIWSGYSSTQAVTDHTNPDLSTASYRIMKETKNILRENSKFHQSVEKRKRRKERKSL